MRRALVEELAEVARCGRELLREKTSLGQIDSEAVGGAIVLARCTPASCGISHPEMRGLIKLSIPRLPLTPFTETNDCTRHRQLQLKHAETTTR
jgi:hypothetical protein